MLDMIVARAYVKLEHLYLHNDERYCLFAHDLLDLDLKVSAYEVFRDENGKVQHQILKHSFSTLPTSFTNIAFKFVHESVTHPFVEFKASPAKILQGHNVYGSDFIENGFWQMLGHLKEAHPKLFDMLDVGSIEVIKLDLTYSARLKNDEQVIQVLDFMRNMSTQYIRKSTKSSSFANTVYFGAECAKRFARKAYCKFVEFMHQLENYKKLAARNDKSAQRIVEVMSDPNLQKFASGLLRFETSIKAFALREHNIPTNVWQLIRYQNQNPHFLKDLFIKANSQLFEAFKGQTIKMTDHESIKKQIALKLPEIKSQNKISFLKADQVFNFYLFLEKNGHTAAKLKYEDNYFRYIGDLICAGFLEDYLKNIDQNPIKNFDHISAYIIVQNKFKKVTTSAHVTDLQINNLFQFYKRLEADGYDLVKKEMSKTRFCDRINDLLACGFSRVFLQNLKSESKSNIIPFIKFVEIKFDEQLPQNFVEPKSSFDEHLIRIA